MARVAKPKDRPLDPFWERKVDEIYMRFNLLAGYDRPTLMNWMGVALRDAYELGLSGQPYQITEPETEAPPAPVRRVRTPAPAIAEGAPVRVVRRRTST